MTATLEFGHKGWLLSIETLQTFVQSGKKTKRQKGKKTKRQKYRNTEIQKDKNHKMNLILRCQGSFTILQCFYFFPQKLNLKGSRTIFETGIYSIWVPNNPRSIFSWSFEGNSTKTIGGTWAPFRSASGHKALLAG